MTWRIYLKQSLLGIIALAVIGLVFVVYERAPPNTFNPFCTYDLTYRLNVTIEVAGKQYSSRVVNQSSRARAWIATIGARCEQTHGTALSFRLADNRLVLISSYICSRARRAIVDTRDDYRYID